MNDKLIEIRVGSNSDIPKIRECYEFLDRLGVNYSARILSAHRTPHEMITEAQNLEKKGFRVSIASAGGSAHIAGMTASDTEIPVVALPVKTSIGGFDSLLSMVQMPPGIPNGCVGIGCSRDAAVLALRIASLDNPDLRDELCNELSTKIQAKLDEPIVNIVSSEDLDLSLLEELGIKYSLDSENLSPITIYVGDVEVDPKIEQISIVVPLSNKDFQISNLKSLVSGPYANVGVDRVTNAFLYGAQILGIYFPEIRENFRNYRKKLRDEVKEKDRILQEKGIKEYL